MYPEQNQTPYPIDYLNQIAAQPQKSGPSRKVLMILVGLGVAIFIIFSMVIFSALAKGPTNDLQHLAARLETLKTVTTTAQPTIKNSQLRSANSSLTITLTNASRDIATPLENSGIDSKKLNQNIVASESGDKLTASLDDAKLNAVYDDTYARELSYQLAATLSLMNKIYTSSSSKSVKDFLIATNNNIEPIKKQFDDFNPVTN